MAPNWQDLDTQELGRRLLSASFTSVYLGDEVATISMALGERRDPSALGSLRSALAKATHPRHALHIAAALARCGDESGVSVLTGMTDESEAVDTEIAYTLLELEDPRTVPVLQRCLRRIHGHRGTLHLDKAIRKYLHSIGVQAEVPPYTFEEPTRPLKYSVLDRATDPAVTARALLKAAEQVSPIEDDAANQWYWDIAGYWSSRKLYSGGASEMEDLVRRNLERIFSHPGFTSAYVHVDKQSQSAGVNAGVEVRGEVLIPVRMWRSSSKLYVCGNSDFAH